MAPDREWNDVLDRTPGAGTAAEPPPIWPYLLALGGLVALGLAFGEMARAARLAEPDSLDRGVIAWVVEHRGAWPGLTQFFLIVTEFGNPRVATSATLLMAMILLAFGHRGIGTIRKREAIFWLCVLVGGQSLNVALKSWFRRARPPIDFRLVDEESFSFPSGHSVYSAIFFAMLAILIVRALPPSRAALRPVAVAACLLMALLVGASRVWLSVHYPTDVIGGLMLGFAWVLVATTIRQGWGHWRRARIGRLVERTPSLDVSPPAD